MENGFINPFADQNSMTSLEKVLKTDRNGTEVADVGRTMTRKKDIIMRGVLSVTVISAEDLPAMDVMGKADPYVVLSMKKTTTKYKTRVGPEPQETLNLFMFLFNRTNGVHAFAGRE